MQRQANRPSSYFLVGASDDEVAGVHGNHISSKLAGEMVLVVHFSPLEIRVLTLCLLKSMSDRPLSMHK